MALEADLIVRSGGVCELCGAGEAASLAVYEVEPAVDDPLENVLHACLACRQQLAAGGVIEATHWHGLSDTMWAEATPVKIMAWRVLDALKAEAWAQELLDIFYLDDDTLARALKGHLVANPPAEGPQHRDCNGVVLAAGDTVSLIKDLNVKGAGFTAKRGTSVRSISLVPDHAGQIEGRVNGQQIVILTEFVKKM